MLKKTWIVGNDGKRYLLKGSFKQGELEPFNEVLAKMICDVIKLNCVSYTIKPFNKIALSQCECFINKNTELISAYAILKYNNIDMTSNTIYESYTKLLEDNGISEVKTKLQKMFILDYLIVNQDRHLGNFGIIRNVETLDWVDIAPNFDSGQSMYSQSELYEMNFEDASGCFFGRKKMDFELILDKVLNDINFEVDFNALKKVPEKWMTILKTYQHISLISDEKIKFLIKGLNTRISKLKKDFKNKKEISHYI